MSKIDLGKSGGVWNEMLSLVESTVYAKTLCVGVCV